MLTTKKTLIAIKTILKIRDSGDEIENEVTSSEIFFSPASCKVASFPLVLDLMYECYVISFPDVFQFFYMKTFLFCCALHISSQKHQGNGIGILFFTLRTRENNVKLKLRSTNKVRFFFVSNF